MLNLFTNLLLNFVKYFGIYELQLIVCNFFTHCKEANSIDNTHNRSPLNTTIMSTISPPIKKTPPFDTVTSNVIAKIKRAVAAECYNMIAEKTMTMGSQQDTVFSQYHGAGKLLVNWKIPLMGTEHTAMCGP